MSLRDEIAAANDRGDGELYEEPEWGVSLLLKSPTLEERNAMLRLMDGGEDGEVDYNTITTSIILATCCDPETGELAFTEDDAAMLLTKNGRLVSKLFLKCKEVGGFDAEARVEAGKDAS